MKDFLNPEFAKPALDLSKQTEPNPNSQSSSSPSQRRLHQCTERETNIEIRACLVERRARTRTGGTSPAERARSRYFQASRTLLLAQKRWETRIPASSVEGSWAPAAAIMDESCTAQVNGSQPRSCASRVYSASASECVAAAVIGAPAWCASSGDSSIAAM